MDLSHVLTYLYPGTEWSLAGENYDNLTWHEKIVPKPRREEIEAITQEQLDIAKEEHRKQIRNREKKNDLTLVALFENERKSNPDLKFNDYLDSLEQRAKNK